MTGGAGYIGSHTSARLIESGYDVYILDDLSSGHKTSIHPKALFTEGTIQNQELVRRLISDFEIDSMVHFAGFVEVEESVRDPIKYYQNNFHNAMRLFEVAIASGVTNLIFSSTAAVYGEPKKSPVALESSLNPINPYGASKMFTERLIQDLHHSSDNKFQFAILRYFNVAGAKLDGTLGQISKKATHLIKIACEAATGKREAMGIFGSDYDTKDGTCVRDYIHVEDLAVVHEKALEYLLAGGGSIVANCGYGYGYSVKEVVETVKKVSGVNFKVVQEKRRPGDPSHLVSDPSEAMKMFKWKPQYNDLELICRTAYEWELSLGAPH